MIEVRTIEGIVPVLLTPFDANGGIDADSQVRLTEHLVNLDIGGLWVLGTGSEDMNLTYDKRLEVARLVTSTVKGRVPIVLGAGFFALEDTISFMRDTAELEFDAYHVMPYHPLYSLDRLEWHYRYVADNAPKPVMMYTSGNWCRNIPPEFPVRLRDHPNIAGIKFSSSNAVHNTKVIAMHEPGFQVITAVIAQLFPCLCLGTKAHTSSTASALPEPLIEIYQLFKAGHHNQALAAQHRFNEFMSRIPKGPGQDNFLKAAEEKYILKLRGLCQEYTSSYYRNVNEDEKQQIEAALADYEMLQRAA